MQYADLQAYTDHVQTRSSSGIADASICPAEKPVVVGEFGAQLPMTDRIGIFQAVYDEILDAATDGLPAAGVLLPI